MEHRSWVVCGLSIAVLVLVAAGAATADQRWVEVSSPDIGTVPTVTVDDQVDHVMVEVELGGFFVGEREIEGTVFSELEVPECGGQGEIGGPHLPFRSVLVPVPNGPVADLKVLKVVSKTALTGVRVMPEQAPAPDCGSVEPEFVIDAALYATDAWRPEQPARIAQDAIVRGQRFLVVEVYPLAYNPARGEVVARENVKIQIDLAGPVDVAAEARKLQRRSPHFPTLNASEAMPAPDANPTGIEYLIIADDTLVASAQPLVDWKRKKGFTVEIVAMSTIGTTSAELKSFLQARYDADPDLTFVLLLGDHPTVPSENQGGGMVSDLYYSCLDGSDYLPDIVIGRIPVQAETDCANVMTKILNFDRDVVPGVWHGDYLMAAYLQDYNDHNCQADRWFFETGTHAMHFIRDQVGMGIETSATSDSLSCSPYNWRSDSYPHRFSGYAGQSVPQADSDLITTSGVATQDLATAINGGVSLVQHRDHGAVTGWGDPPFSNTNIAALANGVMTPIVYSINCLTGTFNTSGDCFAEAFMKKYPGGAVGVVAATVSSYSGYNDLMVHGSYDSFWDDYDSADGGNVYPHSFRPSEAYLYGKYYMYHWEGSGYYTQLEFEMFHWFGDPEMWAFTAVPVTPSVSMDATVPVGATGMTVTVSSDGALVAVTDNGTLLGRAFVSGGSADVVFDPVPQTEAVLDVVVTGHNLVPWQGTVEVGGSGLIFSDDFESAGTGAWSLALP